MFKADYAGWYKRFLLVPEQSGLLAMPFHIDGQPFVVLPLVGQFGSQEFGYMAHQASAFIAACIRARDIATYGGLVRHTYSDDTAGFIAERLYQSDDVEFSTIAVTHAGKHAVPLTKKGKGVTLTVVGAQYDLTDLDAPTIGLSEATFLKLICLFFLELPRDLIPGESRLRIKTYQRLGSYMCLASHFIPSLKPYTHGVYANIAGLPVTAYSMTINSRTILDVATWRATLYATCYSIEWLRVPLSVPPLVNRPKEQAQIDFWHYQASCSHVIVGTDAATLTLDSPTWGGGWTAKRPDHPYFAWGMYEIDTFAETFRILGFTEFTLEQLSLLDQINLYEAIMVVVACDVILNNLPFDRPDHIVLFVWCDNMSAIAWLTRYKNNHPAINFVLQVWCRLQCKHRATINTGHIMGVLNTDPDAISRFFRVLHGSLIRDRLSHMEPHQSLPLWYQGLLTCSMQPSETAWHLAASTLTTLVRAL